ncbi:unnamed protein product [Cunninghamella echinulata]
MLWEKKFGFLGLLTESVGRILLDALLYLFTNILAELGGTPAAIADARIERPSSQLLISLAICFSPYLLYFPLSQLIF